MKKLSCLIFSLIFVLCSCNYRQKEAVKAEPSIIDDDQLINIISSDTTHYKVVYIFSDVCKPCIEHLRDEMCQLYKNRDTSQWKFYLVATFNHLRCSVPDTATGELVELSFADNIRHFAAQYRHRLTALGYDMSDVYFLYNANWEMKPGLNDMIQRMFSSDKPYRSDEYVPQFLKADSENHLWTEFVCECDTFEIVNGKLVPQNIQNTYYKANDDYLLEKFDYCRHDTIYSIRQKKP